MLRRQIRERREFIYRKSEQARARKIEATKRKAREESGLHLDDKINQPSYEQQEAMKLREFVFILFSLYVTCDDIHNYYSRSDIG